MGIRERRRRINAYLDILAGRFSTSLELAALELQIQIVSNVAGHYDVGETKLLREANVLEE